MRAGQEIADLDGAAALTRLLAETRALAAGLDASAQAFAAPLLAIAPGVAPDISTPPQALPMVADLPACGALAGSSTQALTDAIVAAREALTWRRSYGAAAGLGEAFLAGYGWFNLVSPEGPYRAEGFRAAVGYWGPGLRYPAHAHEPEEIYVILAGGARFYAEGRAPRRVGPGDLVRHPAWLPHAMAMDARPLLALGLLRGDAVDAPSTLAPGDPLGMARDPDAEAAP